MKFRLSYFTIAFLPLIFTSCLFEQEQKVVGESEKQEVASAEEWEWKSFSASDMIKLGTLPVNIHPRKTIELKSEAAGIITLHVQEEVSNIQAGFLWAEMNSERLTAQKERLTIQERKQSLNNIKVEQLELPERKAKAYEELNEARRRVALLGRMLESKAMDKVTNLLGISSSEITQESLSKAKEALDLAERKMQYAEEHEYLLRKDEKRLFEMDMTENKKQFQEAKSQSEYYVPFDGELRMEIGLIPDQRQYTVGNREKLATLSDYSEIHAYLAVNNAAWISLEPDKLSLRLKDKSRTKFSFLDDRYVKDNRGKEKRNYVFKVNFEDNEELRRLTGSTLDADLTYDLGMECFIVPKLKLSLHAMDKSNSREWDSIVKDLFPEAQLVAEGLEHLAIYLPAELSQKRSD